VRQSVGLRVLAAIFVYRIFCIHVPYAAGINI
jgi:hypothetical protein